MKNFQVMKNYESDEQDCIFQRQHLGCENVEEGWEEDNELSGFISR